MKTGLLEKVLDTVLLVPEALFPALPELAPIPVERELPQLEDFRLKGHGRYY